MDRFEYLIGLISVIVGLGLADIAISVHRLVKQRAVVCWDSLALTTAAVAAVTMVWIWFNIWDLRGLREFGTFWFYLTVIVEMFLLFLAAAAVLPDEKELESEQGLDLAVYYRSNRAYIWTMLGLFHAAYATRWIYFISGSVLGGVAPVSDTLIGVGYVVTPIALCVALAYTRRRAIQWLLIVTLIGAKLALFWTQTI